MTMVVEEKRGRVYLSPNQDHEETATKAKPVWEPEGEIPYIPRNFNTPIYGLKTFASLFTPRQLMALTIFSDLIGKARERVLADARAVGRPDDPTPLHEDGTGATAYADAVATYLAFAVSKASTRSCSLAIWEPGMGRLAGAMGRQALPMQWSYAETNPLAGAGGDIAGTAKSVAEVLDSVGLGEAAPIRALAAQRNNFADNPIVIATDPPYYDNIEYAALSDFFYVWLKRSLFFIWPDHFRRLTTPKDEELVANPYRHGGRDAAEAFFMRGMEEALRAVRKNATGAVPLTLYYAFKQSEIAENGITSAGWASFLQAMVDAGLAVDSTWPMRTEATNALKAKMNALASSVVLGCRKRPENALATTRSDFLRALRREMPEAVDKIRKAGVGPVDMPQSVIGPGMGVFTRYARVLEDDDRPMTVKTALALINRVWGEIEDDLDANFDPETQVALAWFATYGFDARSSGDLINIATAKNTIIEALFRSGVFQNLNSKAGLTPRDRLPDDWSPEKDPSTTVWVCVQHTARALRAKEGGAETAARLVAAMGAKAEDARKLAYRLYEIASQKGWAAEALVYNELAQDWTNLEDRATQYRQLPPMPNLFGEVAQ